ncbi:MAG: hypothetical protein ACI9BF_000778 [Candidatus Paceibacteria bacterium]|jgi:hypothetical protein
MLDSLFGKNKLEVPVNPEVVRKTLKEMKEHSEKYAEEHGKVARFDQATDLAGEPEPKKGPWDNIPDFERMNKPDKAV